MKTALVALAILFAPVQVARAASESADVKDSHSTLTSAKDQGGFGQTWQCLQSCTYQNSAGQVWTESAVSYCSGDASVWCNGTCNPTSAQAICQ